MMRTMRCNYVRGFAGVLFGWYSKLTLKVHDFQVLWRTAASVGLRNGAWHGKTQNKLVNK